MGDEGKTCYCKCCKQWVTKKECAGIVCKRCYDMIQKINEHNRSRIGKGVLCKDCLFQFASRVASKKCRDKKWRAYYDNSLDKIFTELKSFQKINGDMDIEELVCVLSHEILHKWLFDNQGIRATHMLDYALIRKTMDINGFLGFIVDRGDSYYSWLLDLQLKKEELMKINKV